MVDEMVTSQEAREDAQLSGKPAASETPEETAVPGEFDAPIALEAVDVPAEPEAAVVLADAAEPEEPGALMALGGNAVLAEAEETEGPDVFVDHADSQEGAETEGQQIIVDEEEAPEKAPIPLGNKVAGAAKMVGGAALAAAAVPLVVVPIAPTSLMAVGGVTLAAKGQREFSGREISKFEEKAEIATEKITKVTKNTTGGILSRLGEASTRAAQKLSETDWDEKLGLNEE